MTQFECHGQDGRCIGNILFKADVVNYDKVNFYNKDKSLVCDGNNDCLNNHDEENCPELVCPSGLFKCILDNICINQTKRCDGISSSFEFKIIIYY